MLSKRLKEETNAAHQSLEKAVLNYIKSINDAAHYAVLLKAFYGYFKPIEVQLDQFFNDENIPFYSDRRKSALILEDLAATGSDADILPLVFDAPVIDNVAKALGSFYVLEGSTLGGSIIADILINRAGMSTANTRFFNVYAENKEMMWQTFKEKLDDWPGDKKFGEEVIRSAYATFSLFGRWLKEQLA